MKWIDALTAASVVIAITAAPGAAQTPESGPGGTNRVALDDVWLTGPMLANSAATLPRGHVLIEPYVYDVASEGSNGYGSRTYALYGASNRLTIGVIPVLGMIPVDNAAAGSGVRAGDLTLLTQYSLTQFHAGRSTPATAVMVQETLPTGKFDRLGDRPADGLGAGSYTTTVGFNAQTYAWLPTGRVLRMRLNVSESMSRRASIAGVSVYGTADGFHGTAAPGPAFLADLSWEYSARRRVALAADVFYAYSGNTRVRGLDEVVTDGLLDTRSIVTDSGSRGAVGVAPAIELSWTRNVGVLLGVRVIPGHGRTSGSITPAVAINFVH